MKLVAVDVLPKKRTSKKDLQRILEYFVSSEEKVARVDFTENEYKSVRSCQASLQKAAKISNLPVKVFSRDGNVYLLNIAIPYPEDKDK